MDDREHARVSAAPESGPGPAPRANRRIWLWLALVAIAAAAIWAYPKVGAPSLVGQWSNRTPQNQVTFTFERNGSGAMSIGDARLEFQYTLDRSHVPAWLDLRGAVEGKPVTIRAIAELPRRDKLKIRMPHTRTPGERPTEFVADDVESTILLTRVESAS
jgi:hypothetical protein